MSHHNLLVELFVEELPPKSLKKLGESFGAALAESLKSSGLLAEASQVNTFATPRRLAVHISEVAEEAANKTVAHKLMPASVGLDANGNASPALLKKLQALGQDVGAAAKLRKEHDGKADILFLDALQAGAKLQEGLQKALDEALAKLPIPKVMTYQINDGWQSVNFVRPAHGLIALHGNAVVPVSVLGLSAGNTTQGHRFEARQATITIQHADTYAAQLSEEGAVLASFEARRVEIVRQLNAAAAKESLQPIQDDALLDEVTALVERPNVLLGQFEEAFLEVPQECLILTMKSNQKYFPLLDAKGKLTNKFLIVSNISPEDPSKVIGGNERVVRPRLADAKFFFDQDRKKTLESRLEGLSKVVYHNKLGSQGERNARVVAIASAIAQQLGENGFVAKVVQAAKLSKADLLTDMVGEFPELQGIMGRYYAQHQGLDNDIAFAIEDHYKPRFAGDELPRSEVGMVVALADKLETVVGMFGISEKPTGDKDPFALRRHALGVIRLLSKANLNLSLDTLLKDSNDAFIFADALLNINQSGQNSVASSQTFIAPETPRLVSEFIFERLSGSLREQGYSSQETDAVLSLNPQMLGDVAKRLAAVRAFSILPEAPALSAANKRVSNILKKVEGTVDASINESLLQEAAEKSLASALATIKPKADSLFESGDYTGSLQALAALKAPVDDFFDNVMVNADDPALKANRLGLLATLQLAMNRVADLSKLAN